MPKGKIVVTGAIGDFGTTTNTNKAGKPNPNGGYVKIKLHQGGFRVNAVALNKKLNSLQPTFNAATCSASGTGSANVTVFDGTGLYAGISGKIKITAAFAFVGPRLANGKCNMANERQASRPVSVDSGLRPRELQLARVGLGPRARIGLTWGLRAQEGFGWSARCGAGPSLLALFRRLLSPPPGPVRPMSETKLPSGGTNEIRAAGVHRAWNV